MTFAIGFRKQNKGSNDAATQITKGAAVFTILLNVIIIGTITYNTRRLEEVHRAQKNFHPVAWDK